MLRHLGRASGILAAGVAVAGAQSFDTSTTAIPLRRNIPPLAAWVAGTAGDSCLAVDSFVQREPGDGTPASQPTRAWLVQDGATLVVVFHCAETQPDGMRARLARREAIAGDDQAGVILDTFHDRRHAYLFLANPRGVQSDALLTDGQDDDFAFDAIWDVESRIESDGYWLRFAIPFKSLRVQHAVLQTWAIGLTRVIPRTNEQVFWPAVTRRVEGTVQQLAAVRLAGVDAGHDLQIVPYGVADAEAHRPRRGAGLDWTRHAAGGADAKVVVRNAFALDLTVNPDFSQIESDEPQVTSNQRFEVFFPEKRPFFLENAGFFQMGAVDLNRGAAETLFFSRRIADPNAGVRITGRAGAWAVGALIADDAAPGHRLQPGDADRERNTAIGVARIQRVIRPGWTLAGTATHWNLARRANDVGALDVRARLWPAWTLAAWVAASRTGTSGASPAGLAANVHLKRTGRGAQVSLLYLDRSPEFHTELGFSPRTDVRLLEHYGEYRWRPRHGPVLAYGPNSFFRVGWDHAGGRREWIVRFPFQVDLRGQTSLFCRRVESFDRRGAVGIRGHLTTFNASTNWWRCLGVSETLDIGVAPNFSPAAGRSPEPARVVTGTFDITVRPAPRLQIRGTYLYNRLRTLPGAVGVPGTAVIFDHHTARLRVALQFTRTLALRTIVDYDGLLANPDLFARARSKRLAPDVLMSYFVRPGTAVYVGYTDVYTALDDTGAPGSGDPTILSERRLFTKLSYLLRF